MNNCVLVGKVKENPTIKETSNGNRLAQLLITVDRPYKNGDGENDYDTFQINLWNAIGEECLKSVKKDMMVAMRCRLQDNNYERDEGIFYRVELVAEKLIVL